MTTDRSIDVFFYGLFMDVELLRASHVTAVHPRRGYVDGFALRIGQRATLVPADGARAYGVIIGVGRADLERLYAAPGLELYRPEAVLARTLEGASYPALCYNLREAPAAHERNPDYAVRLQGVLRALGFPSEYIAAVG